MDKGCHLKTGLMACSVLQCFRRGNSSISPGCIYARRYCIYPTSRHSPPALNFVSTPTPRTPNSHTSHHDISAASHLSHPTIVPLLRKPTYLRYQLVMEDHLVTLPHKSSAPLHISLYIPPPSPSPSTTLLVFLNGLLLPRTSWLPTLTHLLTLLPSPPPLILTYDRFGQGTSPPDPSDPPSSHGHPAPSIVHSLHSLLLTLSSSHLTTPLPSLRLILIANSIGCPLARLYTTTYPGTVAGLLLLDSMIANTDFVSLFPDPDSKPNPPPPLPDGITPADIRHARERFRAMFHPNVRNAEGFDRRNLRTLLPEAGEPKLPAGPGGKGVVLVVVGHDGDVFAEEAEKVCCSPFILLPGCCFVAWRGEGCCFADGSVFVLRVDGVLV